MQASDSQRRSPGLAAATAATLLFLTAGAVLSTPLLTYPLGRDQGVFTCVADIVARGGVPYRDAWEMKPPGVFYLYWSSFAMFGRSVLAPRLLDVIWTLVAALALWRLGRYLLSPWAGLAGAFFFLIRYVAGHSFWNTTQCEGFASLPLALAAAALVAAEERRSRRYAAACGALVALAVTLKFTVGVFLLVPLAAALASQAEPLRARIARAACYLAGCLAILAAVSALLWKAGAFKDMVEILFVWNARYAGLKVPSPLAGNLPYQTGRFLVGTPHTLLFPIGLLALFGAADLAARREAGRMRWLVPTWALAMMASVWVQGKYYTYHWLPVLPPLGLLAAQGLRSIRRLLDKTGSRLAATGISIAGLLAVFSVLALAYWSDLNWPLRYALGRIPRAVFLSRFDRYGRSDFSLAADQEIAAFVREHTPRDASLFVWGFEPLIYFLSDRPPASRFIYQVPLVTDWSPSAWRQELMRDLQRNQPAHVIVAHNDVLPWMTGRWDDSAGQLAAFPELNGFLDERYRLVRRIEDFDIWALKEPARGNR